MTSTGVAATDVRDMLVVHTALLREIRLAPAAIMAVNAGDHDRARVVTDHLGFVLELLHHHHEGEDELLWPKLEARVEPNDKPVLEKTAAQHAALDAQLSEVNRVRMAWATEPSAETREALRLHVGHLLTLLEEHLELEERAVLPLAARLLTQAEWDAVGEKAVAVIPKSQLPLVFGMFAYEGDPAMIVDMLSAAPAPIRRLLPPLARRAYARRARQVYGTPAP